MKFGKAFSDNVIFERDHRGLFSTQKPSWWLGAGRPLLFTSFMICVFFILLFRLFVLTVVQGHTYRILSDSNRTKQLSIHAPRGELLDRTGKQLAYNVPSFRILKPCDENPDQMCTKRITQEEGEALKVQGLPQKWFLEVDYKRTYSEPEALFHVIGYIGEVTGEELEDEYFTLRGYRMGDMIGRFGAEKVFEDQLRGKDGKEFVEVDAQGGIVRVLGKASEVKGTPLTLSIDKSLAHVVERAFPKGEKGAVVVSKPNTGEILALYSSPSFSSDILTGGMSQDMYQKFITNPDQPFFNRAIGGVYPPASTYKIVTSVAALEEQAIEKNTFIEDTGEIKIGIFSFPNWYFKQYGKTDGMVDVVKALKRSNDIFFYKAGEKVGISKLGMWSKKMGLGSILGIELPGEASGLVPDGDWKKKMFTTPEDILARNNEWYLGDTYHMSIGQGYLLATPLQVHAWTNAIANGGRLCKPTIKKLSATNRSPRWSSGEAGQSSNCTDVGIQKETLKLITEGMREACSAGGTGWPLFNFGIRKQKNDDGVLIASTSGTLTQIPVACKTGTAEYGDPKNKTHAWFTVFAPLPDVALAKAGDLGESIISGEPEISVTVLIEGAGEGSDKAAPVAKKILEEWFGR